MEVTKAQSTAKLFSQAHLILACFVSGPIGSSLLMAKNYKSMGDEEKKRESLMIGFGVTLVLMFIGIKIHIFAPILAMLNLLAMEKWYKNEQLNMFVLHVKNGGDVYTWKAALLLCLISIAVGAVLSLLLVLLIVTVTG